MEQTGVKKNFLYCFSFGTTIMLTSQNAFENVPSSSIFWKRLCRIGVNSPRLSRKTIWILKFPFGSSKTTNSISISLIAIGLLKLPISC